MCGIKKKPFQYLSLELKKLQVLPNEIEIETKFWAERVAIDTVCEF